jgi:hypothetical protein
VGESRLEGAALPESLEGTRISSWYSLEPAGETGTTRALAEVAGDPWVLEGTDAVGRRYLLLASPLSAAATSLPVSTGMVRFVDWVATDWAGSGGSGEYRVGEHLAAPPGATHVRFPSGREVEIDGTRTVRGTGEAGPYTFLAADTTVSVVALNPDPAESRLGLLGRDEVAAAIGPEVAMVSDPSDWSQQAYRSRRGPELWRLLLVMAGVLLILESSIAAAGRSGSRSTRRQTAAVAEA